MKTIICYGDSNTYGYDPRGMLGMRYPVPIIWPSLLENSLEDCRVINEGMNGRPLPDVDREEKYLFQMTEKLKEGDIFLVMLGTNDILFSYYPKAEPVIEKMRRLLEWIGKLNPKFTTLIVGPVYVGGRMGDMEAFHTESIRLNEGYQNLCREYGVAFADAGRWEIPLAFDDVHFTEEGHRIFAGHITEYLKELSGVEEND